MRRRLFIQVSGLALLDSADTTKNTVTQDVTSIGNVKGLTISDAGALSFSTTDALYTGLEQMKVGRAMRFTR